MFTNFGGAAVGAVKNDTYETDLTKAQWTFLQPMLPPPSKMGRPPTDRRRVLNAKGFTVLPKRWIVERTFGWFMRHRRLVRDYERTTSSAEAWIHLVMIRIQLRGLA
jgi:transposase